MSAAPPIVFFGSSGNALTLRDLMRRTSNLEPLYDVVAYIDDYRGDTGIALDGVPVISFARWQRELRDVPCAITLGDPALRTTIARRLLDAGATLPAVYDRDELGDVAVGAGSFIATGSRFGAGTTFGELAQVYPFVRVPERASIGDAVTLCPRVQLFGRITIGDRVFVGASSQLHGSDDVALHVGSDARVTAGTVIRADVAGGCRVYGDPAREIRGMHVVR